MRLSFSPIITTAAVLGHLYVYRRLVRRLGLRRTAERAVAAFLIAMTFVLLLRAPLRQLVGGTYDVVAFGWIAIALYVFTATVVGDAVAAGAKLVARAKARRRATVDPAPDEGRRTVARALPLTMLAGGGLTAAYAGLRAFAPAEVSEVPVRLPGLPRALDGLSIVQLTDLHVGPFMGRRFVERLVAQANALRPDLVAITGDLVDGDVTALGPAIAALGGLRSRWGRFFVTGNHEYYSGVDAWTAFVAGLGITVLRNRRVAVGDRGGTFDLAGVDDWHGARRGGPGYDLDAALRGRAPERATVLLAHQPRNFEAAVARGVGLQLSGHTHGGQMFPLTRLVGLGWPYSRGLYRHGDGQLYVSRGCGFWGPPARLDSPPEIVKVVLTA